MSIIKTVKIKDEYITLGQLLKIVDLVNSGGEVKYFLDTNKVLINGVEDNRRGKKLYLNDLIEIDNKQYQICR